MLECFERSWPRDGACINTEMSRKGVSGVVPNLPGGVFLKAAASTTTS